MRFNYELAANITDLIVFTMQFVSAVMASRAAITWYHASIVELPVKQAEWNAKAAKAAATSASLQGTALLLSVLQRMFQYGALRHAISN
ncbi:hypothetical protein [Bradyrhizobium sp. SZCCHNR1051]|uniref:hypothetical protein n=1 Tax=Bradyrhizobium sp. SZCCHNR1051 TaxID=3057355 RepID=UPI00291677D6|nr:hypothetical protein [Bradyrhizobium sp. SZCCHNR1051]